MSGDVRDPYARIPELYDLEHDEVSDDVELYLALAEEIGGPILELGCGSGRVLAPLLAAGYPVTGIDSSGPMLDRARSRLAGQRHGDRATLIEGDMVHPQTSDRFALILFSLNALMHIDDPESQLDALTNAKALLRPGGRMIVDIMNPAPQYLVDLARSPLQEWSTALPNGTDVDKWSARDVDSVNQTIATTLWYDHVDASGAFTRVRTAFTLRYVHPNELELMFRLAGFTDIQLFGGPGLESLTESSDRIIAIAGA